MTTAPPDYEVPTKLDERFRCVNLRCTLSARECMLRMHKVINLSTQPFFPTCHETRCQQGCAIRKATGYTHKAWLSDEEFAEKRKRMSRRRPKRQPEETERHRDTLDYGTPEDLDDAVLTTVGMKEGT